MDIDPLIPAEPFVPEVYDSASVKSRLASSC